MGELKILFLFEPIVHIFSTFILIRQHSRETFLVRVKWEPELDYVVVSRLIYAADVISESRVILCLENVYDKFEGPGFVTWDPQTSTELSWFSFRKHAPRICRVKFFYALEFGLYLVYQGKIFWSLLADDECSNCKQELKEILTKDDVIVSKNRKLVIIDTQTGIYIGKVYFQEKFPEIQWRFIPCERNNQTKKSIIYFEEENVVVKLGLTILLTYYVDQDTKFSMVVTKNEI